MEKHSIGQFIAILRKANGMTQQEVADRLHVSNKAVSRWEREESAPDISLIPALAELLGVTCDELLKGERIAESVSVTMKEVKVEKQIRSLVNRTLSGFKTLVWISLAVAIIGLVCMFGISYGMYRPVIGFAIMLLFEICALAIVILAVSRTKDVKTNNELFEMAEETMISRLNTTLSKRSFIAFYVIFAVIIVSFPLVLVRSEYINSVVTPYSYFGIFAGGIVLILTLVYRKCRKPYTAWLIHGELPVKSSEPVHVIKKKMSVLQIVMTMAAGVIFVLAPYLDVNPHETSVLYTVTVFIGLACLLTSIIIFMVYLIHTRTDRSKLLIPGIRNLLLIPSALIVSGMHSTGWWYNPGDVEGHRYDFWSAEYLWYALAAAVIVFLFFALIESMVHSGKRDT